MMKYFVQIGIMFLLSGVAVAEFELKLSPLLSPPAPLSGQLLVATPDFSTSSIDMSRSRQSGRKLSMKKALTLSFLMPGAGEYYAGARLKGQLFMAAEASFWFGFVAHRVYSGWKTDDYKAFASAHAEVTDANQGDQFYDWVGFYDNRDEFNQFGRLFFPEREYLFDSPDYHWQWDSEVHRLRFKEIKDDARRIKNNANIFIGLALANRVISAIDTYRTVKSASRRAYSGSRLGQYKLKISPQPFGDNAGVKMILVRKF